MGDWPASVIVRCLDEAPALEKALTALRLQSVRPQIVVVDSGSTDGSLEIARRLADQVVEIPRSSFTYGGALNRGAREASAPILLALSAHCVPPQHWVEGVLRLHRDDKVAATGSQSLDPYGEVITTCYLQTLADVHLNPFWGMSNHASSWRRDIWAQEPFREDLPASEDLEWSWRVLSKGYVIAFAPDTQVSVEHRRRAGVSALWRRIRKETTAIADLLDLPGPSAGEVVHNALVPDPRTSTRSPLVRMFSPYRAIEVVARDTALRQAARARGRGTRLSETTP